MKSYETETKLQQTQLWQLWLYSRQHDMGSWKTCLTQLKIIIKYKPYN